MKELKIECDKTFIETEKLDNQIKVVLVNPYMKFIEDINISDIISCLDNENLFEAIIENDEQILHNYLVQSGYVFNKA